MAEQRELPRSVTVEVEYDGETWGATVAFNTAPAVDRDGARHYYAEVTRDESGVGAASWTVPPGGHSLTDATLYANEARSRRSRMALLTLAAHVRRAAARFGGAA